MRKLKIIEHISLDGVIQVSGDDSDFPYGDWTATYRTRFAYFIQLVGAAVVIAFIYRPTNL